MKRVLCYLLFAFAGVLFADTKIISVLDFGAKGDGIADDTAAIQRALDAARGADGLQGGHDRTVFSLYFPSKKNGFYKITDSLKVDGTHGIVIHGDGALTERGYQNAAIRWYGKESKPVFWVKGGAGKPSNPNFFITFRDLTISGYPKMLTKENFPDKLPSNIALSAIHFGNLAGKPAENTLIRGAQMENVQIQNCRFGVWSGNPQNMNTDHATLQMISCNLGHNVQSGVCWGTGNAIINIIGCHFEGNGSFGDQFPKDAYSSPVGANIHIYAGYADIVSYTSSGTPTHADIYQSAGRVGVTNAWSDTSRYFLYQGGVSNNKGVYHNTHISGVRHYADNPHFNNNTPNSLRIICPGMVVTGCLFYGNVVVDSCISGCPVFAGINFIRKDAGFVGTGIQQQRSMVLLGNAGNHGQIMIGGANPGVPLKHKGNVVPNILSMGENPVVFQALGPSANSSGVEFRASTLDANGSSQLLVNGFYTANGIMPIQADRMVWRLNFGGGASGFSVTGYDPNGKAEAIPEGAFKAFGGFICAPLKGHRDEVTFRPPVRSAAPSFQSGDYWKGSMYFDSTTGKLRLNTGAQNWVDLNK